MSALFEPIALREVTLPNRVLVSPMCQYAAVDGVVGDWHLMHLGALATGKPGLIVAEATAVQPSGRISIACPGIWNDAQTAAWRHVVDFVHEQGTLIGIQLAHAGRKGSTVEPWNGGVPATAEKGGWQTVAPSAVAYGPMPVPHALTTDEIDALVDDFAAAARRADAAGFDLVEIHAAHGYLLHQFLSPLSNTRDDEYGGSLENRTRLVLRVAHAVREAFPASKPVIIRISTTDWMDGGWDETSSATLMRELTAIGIDLVDASSGGLHPDQSIPNTTDYQTTIAARLKKETGAFVGGVGRITGAAQAEELVSSGAVDVVLIGRAMLLDPHWTLRAAHELGVKIDWVPQYARASRELIW